MLFIGRYSVLCNKFNGNAWYIIDNFVNSCYLHCFIGREGWCTSCHASGTAGQLSADRINAESI